MDTLPPGMETLGGNFRSELRICSVTRMDTDGYAEGCHLAYAM